ncbi:flagellar hook-length control protein FliK [Acidovorax sp. LjRoot194]|uniref:flagellar hook-length control protein FliK n=1 Tax=Acidovorax sp. LjRoot194 TaxID=3342280 RepID=UPI003ED06ED3
MEQTKISSSQGTQPAHAARSRSSAPATDTADAAGSGGFLALLAALGDGSSPLDGAPLDLGSAEQDATVALLPDAGKDAADAAAMAAWQGLLAPSAPGLSGVDTATLAQDGVLGGGGRASALNSALVGVDGMPQGLVAETAMLDTSGDLKGGPQPAVGQGFGRAFSRLQSNALAQKADSLEALGGRTAAGDSGKLQSTLQAFTPTVGASFQAMGEPRTAGGGAGERSFSGVPGMSAMESGAPAVDGLLAATASARGGESSGGRSGDGQQGAAAWSDGLSASAPQEAGNVDGSVFTDPAQAGVEEQVADQVAYWVHQKTQNAELTLNRDGQPVEVSVTLSGNEAHVSFRSDQAQTRDMLDRSMAQLSELLRSEGLVLSGMSVGTSAGQGTGSGEQPRQRDGGGTRQAQVVATAPVGTASLQRSGGSPDRAVDVFV